MNTGEREKGLLKLVEDFRERECRRILEEARAQARDLLHQAYRRERSHLHDRVVAERSRAQARIQAARAERSTRERRATERTSVDLLVAAWPRVRAGLLARWEDPSQRRRWIAGYLQQALRMLPRGLWTVRHAAGWADAERSGAAVELAEALGQAPRFETDGSIEAGLIVSSGGAVLDASLEGLLADRPRLEARLLALLEGAEGGES
jgi:hypothetical protein